MLASAEVPLICGGTYTLGQENPKVMVTSPGYGSQYPPGAQCQWSFLSGDGLVRMIYINTIDLFITKNIYFFKHT